MCRLFFLAAVLMISACSRKTVVRPARVPTPPAPLGATETGIASWYGEPYNGRRTSNGEIYDMNKMTAAHKTLAFDTFVEVTNLDNNKKVTVRINDRGPFVSGRIIDLSRAAARKIEMVGPGTARVRLKVIKVNAGQAPPEAVSLAALRASLE